MMDMGKVWMDDWAMDGCGNEWDGIWIWSYESG